jgi:hypothetical protein
MDTQSQPSTQEVLAGLVERVTYHNAENGFCVLRITPIRPVVFRKRSRDPLCNESLRPVAEITAVLFCRYVFPH